MNTAMTNEEVTMPETLITIYERRSVRKYKSLPVDKKIIEKIIDAGRMAPSALNEQCWKFYVVTKQETLKAFSKAITAIAAKEFIKTGPKKIIKALVNFLHFPHGLHFLRAADPVFHSAPVVVFITAPQKAEWASLDVGMCSQNMMLAAKAFGLDSCPVGFGKYIAHTKLYPQLKISASEEILLSIVFGYGDESPDVHKRKTENVFFVD